MDTYQFKAFTNACTTMLKDDKLVKSWVQPGLQVQYCSERTRSRQSDYSFERVDTLQSDHVHQTRTAAACNMLDNILTYLATAQLLINSCNYCSKATPNMLTQLDNVRLSTCSTNCTCPFCSAAVPARSQACDHECLNNMATMSCCTPFHWCFC